MPIYSLKNHPPELGNTPGYGWHVYQKSGALQVLHKLEYIELLDREPDAVYMVNIASGATVTINPEDQLWKEMVEIDKIYDIEVFPLGFNKKYTPWKGDEKSMRKFDAICIKNKS